MCIDLGGPSRAPVGHETLGRVLNVIGEPVDELGPIGEKTRMPIHRPAPLFEEQSTHEEMFETGIKVIDLIQPFLKGGKIGLFGGAGVGKTVIIRSSSTTSPRTRRLFGLCRRGRAHP